MVDVGEYTTEGDKTALWVAYRRLFSDNEVLSSQIELLKNLLLSDESQNEDFKNCIEMIEVEAKSISKQVEVLGYARGKFRNRKMIAELEEKDDIFGRGKMSALFG